MCAYHVDETDENAIVFDGHAEGIADSPYEGISDMRNVNIVPIPGEASVNFATSQISPPTISAGTVTSANSGTEYLTYTGASGLENYMTIVFSASTIGGISTGTAYWIKNLNGAGAGTFQLTSDYAQSSTVNITGTGTGTFAVAKVGTDPITSQQGAPVGFTYDQVDNAYFMLEVNGALWSNLHTTTSGYWTYTGPSGTAQTNQGTGLVYYQASDSTNRYVFVFRNQTIDYFHPSSGSWTFGWKPTDGSANNAEATLQKSTTFHQAILGADNFVYYCDGSYIGRFYQADINTAFDPTIRATYIYDIISLLPFNDIAQCLSFSAIGTGSLLIGGSKNVIYQWDLTAQTIGTPPNISQLALPVPIFIAENSILQMVTVNTNTFIFAGNRGRIYVTNGSQAQVYKKLPDHLSGTVEPYYVWGGVTSNKNQLYFSAQVFDNSNTATSTMGGLWAIDLDTRAMRLANKLSYATYAGYATALIPNFSSAPAGTGLFIGWNSGVTTFGIDTTIGTPYTGSQGYVDYDLIPIGTILKPNTPKKVEWKTSAPLVSGESVSIYYRLKFTDSYTLIFTSSTVGIFSDTANSNFLNAQWIQLRAVLNSTATNPSYTRLTEIRLRATEP